MILPFLPPPSAELRREVEGYLPRGRASLEQLVAAIRGGLRPGGDADVFIELYQALAIFVPDPVKMTAITVAALMDLAKRPIDVPE